MSIAAETIVVMLDNESTDVDASTTVLDLLTRQNKTLWRPDGFRQQFDWINSSSCPLTKVVEIDGQVMAAALAANRPVRDGMCINTRSELLKQTLVERLEHLRDCHECLLIRESQEFVAAEAEADGFIDLKERANWDFDLRTTEPSILHDPNTCVRCKSCVDTCNTIQGVGALSFDEKEGVVFDESKCVRCGQCILSCPVGFRSTASFLADIVDCKLCAFSRPLGAMREKDDTATVWDALKDPDKYVVVQFAPAIRATIGEEFECESGELMTKQLYAALRKLGFDRVWDTNFAADLTIMEEGNELIKRVKEGGVLPQFTSCSPGWIRFCENFFPKLIPNVSSAKSPQQMFGAVAKTYAAEKLGVDPKKMFVVSVMPCTAKKMEAGRDELSDARKYWLEKGKIEEGDKFQDVDVVLTTREAAKLLKMGRIDLANIEPEEPDALLGEYTGAAPIFGRTGGVMEAALRTAYEVLTGTTLEKVEFEELGTLDGVKKATIPINGIDLKVAVAHGTGNAKKVCQSILDGGEFADYHFIEFMGCPGGCIGGGGQPIPTNTEIRKERTAGVNQDDREHEVRKSHLNKEIDLLYKDFLGEPLSHVAHHLLHTEYTDRSGSIE